MLDYGQHPFVIELLQDGPLAVIDGLALDNWCVRHPDAAAEELRAAMLDREHVLWSSHPIDEATAIAAIIQVEPVGDWPRIRVLLLEPGAFGT